MPNPFDQFDGSNPFDKYTPAAKPAAKPPVRYLAPAPNAPVAQWVDKHVAHDPGIIGQAYRHMRQSGDAALAQHDRNAATPAPGATGVFDYIGQEIGGAIGGSLTKLRDDVSSDYNTFKREGRGSSPTLGTSLVQYGQRMKRQTGILGDAAGVVLSPFAGALHGAIVRPAATAAAAVIPGANYTDSEQVISNALGGLGPETGAAGRLARVAPAARAAARPSALAMKAAEHVAAADRAGVRPSLVSALAPDAAPLTKAISENPIAGIRARANMKGALGDTARANRRIAGQYGDILTPARAGESAQEGVTRFAQDRNAPTSFKAKSAALYDDAFGRLDSAMAGKMEPRQTAPVMQPIGPGAFTVGPNGVAPAALKVGESTTGGSQIRATATKGLLDDVLGGVQSRPIADIVNDPTLKRVASAVQSGEGDMTFTDLRRLRTWVRDAQKNDELSQNIGSANLQRLESSLTQDIQTNAEKLGSPALARQLRQADRYYAAGQARIQTRLDAVFKAKSGESAFAQIQRAAQDTSGADISKLTALKRSLASDEWGDIAATMADRLGKPTPGAVGAMEDGAFSVNRFVTNYASLSPAGRETLFGARAGGGARATALKAELENLVKVASNQKAVEAAANHSNTAVAGQSLATLAGLSHPATTIPTGLGLIGGALTGEMMTSPAVVRWVARFAEAKTPAAAQVQATKLRAAANNNAALLPLYSHIQARLSGPSITTPLAAQQTQGQTPPTSGGPVLP